MNKTRMTNFDEQLISRNDFIRQTTTTTNSSLDDLVKSEKYFNGLNIFINQEQFQLSIIDWLTNIAAADLISTKNIDVLISDSSWNLDIHKTMTFDELLKNNYLEIKIFELAKKVAVTGIAGLWFMPRVETKFNNKFSLNADVQIIQFKQVNNETQAVKFLTNLVKGIAIGNVYAMVYADKWKYRTQYYAINPELEDSIDWKDDTKISKYEYSENEILESLNSLEYGGSFVKLLNQDHNLGFVPFFCLFFNEQFTPLINPGVLSQDFDELFAIATKMYDEANMMGTKIKWVNDGDINNLSSKKELITMVKVLGSLAGIYAKGDFNSDNNNADVDLITKSSIYSDLMDAFKLKLNFILKKIGLSSDTDSKGTVQQSIGEIIKQNEFSYNNQNYRNLVLQNYLQTMLTNFFYANENIPDHAKLVYKVKVLSTQSLGMSEMEKLNYVIMSKSNGLIDHARAISILTGKNYIDSWALAQLQELKESNEQPNLFKGGQSYD